MCGDVGQGEGIACVRLLQRSPCHTNIHSERSVFCAHTHIRGRGTHTEGGFVSESRVFVCLFRDVWCNRSCVPCYFHHSCVSEWAMRVCVCVCLYVILFFYVPYVLLHVCVGVIGLVCVLHRSCVGVCVSRVGTWICWRAYSSQNRQPVLVEPGCVRKGQHSE